MMGLPNTIVVAVVVLSGGATLFAPYGVLHLSTLLVEVRSVNESASVCTANAQVSIHFVSNIMDTGTIKETRRVR